MSEIRLECIEKSFDGKKIVDNLTVELGQGQMLSLLGPSGCGKTTTLRMIAGLLEPDGGDILFDGESIRSIPPERREAVIVFQDHRLFPHMTVKGNVEFGLKMRGVSRKKRSSVAEEMLGLVHLGEHGDKYPEELSGGQRQRVAIARALAIKPRVLLLDEPFSNLDLRLREEMRCFISKLQKELGITTIMVTHDKSDALITSDIIAVMMEGSLKQIGSPEELYERPNTIEVASFFGDINTISVGKNHKGILETEFGEFNVELAGLEAVAFRPEDVELSSDKYNFVARVIEKKYAGDRVNYTLLISGRKLSFVDFKKTSLELNREYPFKVDGQKLLKFKCGEV